MAALDNGSGIGVRIERAAGRSYFATLLPQQEVMRAEELSKRIIIARDSLARYVP
jgi:hypothetical protein